MLCSELPKLLFVFPFYFLVPYFVEHELEDTDIFRIRILFIHVFSIRHFRDR